MSDSFLFCVVLVSSFAILGHACSSISVSKGSSHVWQMSRLSLSEKSDVFALHQSFVDSGRAIYSNNAGFYLYHCRNESSGEGRWEIGTSFCDTAHKGGGAFAVAFSWAVAPHLTAAASDSHSAGWKVSKSFDEVLEGNIVQLQSQEADFVADETFQVSCSSSSEEDSAAGIVYFESSASLQPQLAGFYIQHAVSNTINGDGVGTMVYVQVKEDLSVPSNYYLFSLPRTVGVECDNRNSKKCSRETETTWLVGDRYGEDAGLAFTRTRSSTLTSDCADLHSSSNALQLPLSLAQQQHSEQISQEWSFVSPKQGNRWVVDPTAALYGIPAGGGGTSNSNSSSNNTDSDFSDIYSVLRAARSIRTLPAGQSLIKLRNGYGMPQIGLGTGGIYLEEAPAVFASALQLGYRLLDLAREYGNEHIVPAVLDSLAADASTAAGGGGGSGGGISAVVDGEGGSEGLTQRGPTAAPPVVVTRRDLFLESKVWPTQLGFLPTSRAVRTSLQQLRTNYADLYLLHWPRCDPSIEWMHCQTTEEVGATWEQSYWALARAYAEGRVMAIGVSNFDAPLLAELLSSAGVGAHSLPVLLPHVVQNWAEPGRTDATVRRVCADHGIIYQPYAPLRNLKFLSPVLRQALQNIARRRGVSEHTVALRFFVQLGASVIPRSRSWEHLRENLNVSAWALDSAEMKLLFGESS